MILKLILFLPLIGFLIAGILSQLKNLPMLYSCNNLSEKKSCDGSYFNLAGLFNVDKFCQFITCFLVLISAILSIFVLIQFNQTKNLQIINLFSWINSGSFVADWQIRLDSLVAIMLVVVTFISSLVHLYSICYMSQDSSISRFMAYLSLFTFFMLALVTSNNFLQLFFGWEGVGLASYLLIGFWFKKESANLAAMKAFITNRIGDLGLIIAIALIYFSFDSVEYSTIFSSAAQKSSQIISIFGHNFFLLDLISFSLFIGAMGKSAQIILHVWLADAMEGPTPVSALIHAATMVTAGVFLVARCSPIFELSANVLNLVTIIGALTAIFAATIAITQNDIKKIIAYSTCSQLGYMFFACGISAYSAAVFHLATHAFFKALLFLSAGSVIHALHHEQNIQKMGGLAKKIPLTCFAMWIGSLALAGFPPLAGFFSKDLILEAAYQSHSPFGKFAYYLGLTAAFLTAFYSWRLIFLVFYGKNRGNEKYYQHAHEGSLFMRLPLIILIIGSIFAGILGVKYFNFVSVDNNFFNDAIIISNEKLLLLQHAHHAPLLVKFSAIIVGIVAISLAFVFYLKCNKFPTILASKFSFLYKISLNKYYFDEIYEACLIKPIKKLSLFLWKIIDVKIIDSVSAILSSICKIMSRGVSQIQTGAVYNHALAMIIGVISIIFFALLIFVQYLL